MMHRPRIGHLGGSGGMPPPEIFGIFGDMRAFLVTFALKKSHTKKVAKKKLQMFLISQQNELTIVILLVSNYHSINYHHEHLLA